MYHNACYLTRNHLSQSECYAHLYINVFDEGKYVNKPAVFPIECTISEYGEIEEVKESLLTNKLEQVFEMNTATILNFCNDRYNIYESRSCVNADLFPNMEKEIGTNKNLEK